ncbi:MAG: EamA family transporter [Lachnospiraceae bacterium]|nr:EamA family transporter [Lachnospiraceae bacterium]
MILIYFCLVVMTFSGALASLFLKKASGSSGIVQMLVNINLYIGGALYVTSAVMNILVLRYLDYSVVLPLTSLTYIWAMVLAHFALKEKIGFKKILGVCLIFAGAVLISIGI